jgi:hypothetical protein
MDSACPEHTSGLASRAQWSWVQYVQFSVHRFFFWRRQEVLARLLLYSIEFPIRGSGSFPKFFLPRSGKRAKPPRCPPPNAHFPRSCNDPPTRSSPPPRASPASSHPSPETSHFLRTPPQRALLPVPGYFHTPNFGYSMCGIMCHPPALSNFFFQN